MLRIDNEPTSTRALRISPGSLLGRQFDMADLRGSVREAMSEIDKNLPLSDESANVVKSLEQAFRNDGLPSEVGLGFVSPQGSDLLSMVELVNGPDPAAAIPIGLMGSGTRTLVALNVLARLVGKQSIVLIEEPERGLEPFKQRVAANRIVALSSGSQAFVTTHSPTMLEEMASGNVWRVEREKTPISLSDELVVALFKADAEAVFSPTALICEGATECGFLSVLLPQLTGKTLNALGIRLVDGNGQPQCLNLADKLADAGMRIAIFVDNEGTHVGTRAKIAEKVLAFVWNNVTNLEEAVARYLPYREFPRIMRAARMDEQYALCLVRDALPLKVPATAINWAAISASEDEADVRVAIYRMSSRHSWYKTFDNGAALAGALIEVGIPREILDQLGPFAQALK
jgi:putative ATP-dependent endonuclease of OLD family